MKSEVIKYVRVFLISIILISAMCYVMFNSNNKNSQVDTLVIFGENTDLDEKHKAFVEDGCVYIALSTFYKTVDTDIFYDEFTQKVKLPN